MKNKAIINLSMPKMMIANQQQKQTKSKLLIYSPNIAVDFRYVESSIAEKRVEPIGVQPTQFIWFLINENGQTTQTGVLDSFQSLRSLQPLSHQTDVVLMISSALFSIHSIEVPGKFTKQIEQNLIYQLEDCLAEDIEDVFSKVIYQRDSKVELAVISQCLLDFWLKVFSEANIELHAILPDIVCFPEPTQGSLTYLPKHLPKHFPPLYFKLSDETTFDSSVSDQIQNLQHLEPFYGNLQNQLETFALLKIEGNWICRFSNKQWTVFDQQILKEQSVWIVEQFIQCLASKLETESQDKLVLAEDVNSNKKNGNFEAENQSAKNIDYQFICYCAKNEFAEVMPLFHTIMSYLPTEYQLPNQAYKMRLIQSAVLGFNSIADLFLAQTRGNDKNRNTVDKAQAYNLMPKKIVTDNRPLISTRWRRNFILAGILCSTFLGYEVLNWAILAKENHALEKTIIQTYNAKSANKKTSVSSISADLKRKSSGNLDKSNNRGDFIMKLYRFPEIFKQGVFSRDYQSVKELSFSKKKSELTLKVGFKSHQELKQIQENASKFFNVVDTPITQRNQQVEASLIWQTLKE